MDDIAKAGTDERPIQFFGKCMGVDVVALKAAFGSESRDFVNGLARQLTNIGSIGPTPDEEGVAFVTSVVSGIEPRDQLEAMLAAQMAAVHSAIMTTTRRLAHVEELRQLEVNERALNRLTRTYALQLDALKRYRTGGQQKVTVEHVTVESGGQAIVGSVEQTATKVRRRR